MLTAFICRSGSSLLTALTDAVMVVCSRFNCHKGSSIVSGFNCGIDGISSSWLAVMPAEVIVIVEAVIHFIVTITVVVTLTIYIRHSKFVIHPLKIRFPCSANMLSIQIAIIFDNF